MMQKLLLSIVLLVIVAIPVFATEEKANPASDGKPVESLASEGETGISTESGEAAEASKPGFGHKLIFYIPNRVLDIFDFMRLRLRVGPGIAAGLRATKPLTLSIGGYTSIYAGLPGPRLKPTVNFPIGIENYAGIEASIFDGSTGGKFSPNYSPTEIGASVHPIIIGLDFCVDPIEVIDFALGFLFIDLRGDDF